MKLFLCGGGCGDQVKEAYKVLESELEKSKPILYVPLAMDSDKYESCKEWFQNEKRNFGVDKFYMIQTAQELCKLNLKDYCGLFIGGGNTFKLLKELRECGADKEIVQYLNKGGLVFGGSAGAIIFGKDINGCNIDDGNLCNLKDTAGLNLARDVSFLCHLNQKHFDRNVELLKSLSQTNRIIYLPEEDTIYINNRKIKILGKTDYYLFYKGKFRKRKYFCLKKDLTFIK